MSLFKNQKENNQLDLLCSLVNLLKENNIESWLAYGTLLGAIRENEFIEDNDIDIGLHYKDYWKVRKVLEYNRDWKFKHIWRTEIAVYKNKNCHIDLFFFEEDKDVIKENAYLAHRQFNTINMESQSIYPKNTIYPLKTINFKGIEFNVPNKPEEWLKLEYGNWKKPDPNWYHSKGNSLNLDHSTIGIIITTFLRDKKLFKEVESILKYCNYNGIPRRFVRLYIADQGHSKWSDEKIEFYNKLKEKGHKIYKLPFNSGLSYCRNFLIKKSTEPYLMIVDDDFEFTKNTNLCKMIEVLNHKEFNGIVGGNIENRASYNSLLVLQYNKDGNKLYRIKRALKDPEEARVYSTQCNSSKDEIIPYYYTDIVLNFALYKREVFDDVKFDNELKLVEHTDYFLRLKQNGKWKVCYLPQVTCKHQPKDDNSKEYLHFRTNKYYVNLYRKKWNLKDEKSTVKLNEEDFNFYIPKKDKIKVVQLARIPCANSGYEVCKLINKYSDRFESRYILGGEYSRYLSEVPYRKFPYDLYWREEKDKCIQILRKADIIHIHHDWYTQECKYIKDKKVISTLYNLTNSLKYKYNSYNKRYIEKLKNLSNIVTVADQPLQKIFFEDITTRTLPLVKMLFNRERREINDKIRIVFSPTNKDKQGVASKRYSDVIQIIENLKSKGYKFEFDLVTGLPYEENLERKSKADIIIDDVDDNYEKFHNTSIEGACFGAIPLTNFTSEKYPFVKVNIHSLEDKLEDYLNNRDKILDDKSKIVEWRQKNYTPENLLSYYENLYYEALSMSNKEKEIIEPKKVKPSKKITFPHIDELKEFYIILLEQTCKEMVIERKEVPTKWIIATNNPKKAKELLGEDIIIKSYTGKVKELVGYYVPYPVIGYLENHYIVKKRRTKNGLEYYVK